MKKILHRRWLHSIFLLAMFFTVGASWGQINYSLSRTFNSAAVDAPGITVTYDGLNNTGCSTASNGATGVVTMTLTAQAGFSFTITGISAAGYRSGAGSDQFRLEYVNTATSTNYTGSWTSIGSSSSCSGNTSVGSLTYTGTTQTVNSGQSVTIRVRRQAVSTSGGGYANTRNINVSGVVTGIGTVTSPSNATLAAFPDTYIASTSATTRNFIFAPSAVTGNIVVTAPEHFGVSQTSTGTFTNSVTFANNTAAKTIYVKFMPTTEGSKSGVITVAKVGGGVTQRTVSVSGVALAVNPPVITSELTASSEYGTTGSYQITASNTPNAYSATYQGGALPAGITLNATSGVLSFDAALTAGIYNIDINASNAGGGYGTAQTLVYTRTKKPLILSGGTAQSKVYDGTASVTINGLPGLLGIVGTDEVQLQGTADAGVLNTNVGTQSVQINGGYTLTGANAANYFIALPQQPEGLTAVITPKEITVTGIIISDKNYDGTTGATITGTAELSGVVEGDDVALVTINAVAQFTSANTGVAIPVTVTGYEITGTAVTNYVLQQPQGLTANINDTGLQSQTITFNALNAVTYGDPQFTLNATASSGLEVTFTSSDEEIATVSGNTVTIVGAGTVTITASQNGDSAYNPAQMVPQELVVNPKALIVVNAAVTPKVYDTTTTATVTGSLDGIVGSDQVFVSGTGVYASDDASANITVSTNYTLSGDDIGNYTITQPGDINGAITPATLTLTDAVAQDKIYDGTTAATINGTLNGILGNDVVLYGQSGAFASPVVASNIDVMPGTLLTGTDAANYTLAQATTVSASITARPVTVTATAQDKVYDGTDVATVINAAISEGAVAGDNITLVSDTVNGTFDSVEAGIDKSVTAVFALTGTHAANYSITPQTYIADITPAPLTADVSAAIIAPKTYDSTNTATVTGAVFNGVVNDDTVNAAATFVDVNAAEGIAVTLLLSGQDAANYSLQQPSTPLTGNITKKAITATAEDKFKSQGAANPAFTIAYDGFVAGESEANALGFTAPAITTTATTASAAGAYAITLTGGNASNYNFTELNNGFLIIQPTSASTMLLAWDFNGEANAATSTAEIYATGLDASQTLTRGTGAVASAGSNSFRTVGFQNNGISTNNSDYFQFQISGATGQQLSLSTIDARFAGTPTFRAAPGASGQFAYSLNGTTFTLIGSPFFLTADTTMPQIDLTGIAALQNLPASTTVTFRYYASGQTTTGGWGFNSPAAGNYGLSIGGSLAPAPSIPAISNTNLNYTFVYGNGGSYDVDAAGSPTITYSATNLPADAVIDAQTGVITFANTTPVGTYSIGLSAQSYYGTDTETLTLEVTPVVPVVIVGGTQPFEYGDVCVGTTAVRTFTLTGQNFESFPSGANITVSSSTPNVNDGYEPLNGFNFSLSGGAYTAGSYIIEGYNGNEISIDVQFAPNLAQDYTTSGEIALTYFDAASGQTRIIATIDIATATGIDTPFIVTTGAAESLTQTSAQLSASATTVCSTIATYGIEYSTVTGFENGTGTMVQGSNMADGNYTVALADLHPCTAYYYKAYSYNGTAYTYGTQQTFTTLSLAAPVALEATNVIQTGFTANWQTNAGATGYYLDVSTDPNFRSTVENMLFAENFSGFTAPAQGEADSNIASSLNTYTTLPGWTGANIYRENGLIRLSNGSAAGQITTPSIDLTANGGTVTFSFRAKDSDASNQPVITVYYSANGTSYSAVAGGVFDLTGEFVTYSVTINNATATSKLRIAANTAGQRFHLDDFKVFYPTEVDVESIELGNVTSHTVSNLIPDTQYYYRVRAFDTNCTSEGSNTIEVKTPAYLTITNVDAEFGSICTTAEATGSITFTGVGMTNANLDIAALNGYSYSLTENGSYTPTLAISGYNGESQTVYVKFSPTAAQSYNGDIVITAQAPYTAAQLTIAATATGISTPAVATAGTAGNITNTTATVAGQYVANCSVVTEYGIAYSTTNNFANGTGTILPATAVDENGNFSVSLSALNPCTTYYYKAYATSSTGTVYSTQQSFITPSLSALLSLEATNVTDNSFRANWQTIDGATGYRVDVSTNPEFGTAVLASNLIISEYGEGSSGNKKYIEIFNGTGAAVNLANYRVWVAANGAAWPGASPSQLAGTLANGDVFVVANNSADVPGADWYISSLNHNGDDAVGLAWNGGSGSTYNLLDAVGTGGSDPGTGWSVAGVANATVDRILIRKPSVKDPNTNWTASAGTNITNSEWTVSSFTYSAIDQTTDLGLHTFTSFIPDFLTGYQDRTASTNLLEVTGLEDFTTYYYRVRATSTSCTSGNSEVIEVITKPSVVSWEIPTGNTTPVWVPTQYPNGTPVVIDGNQDVAINADYNTATNGSFTAKNITVTTGKKVVVATGTTLTADAVINNGTPEDFLVQNNGALLQGESATENSGNVTVIKNSNPLFRLDYTLWSSPVSGTQTLGEFSPQTTVGRFYEYGIDAGVEQYLIVPPTTTFTSAKGYLIRMPNGNLSVPGYNAGSTSYSYIGSFVGTPN
ncbi:hypothetical protein GR160_18260, partial [Flavobacterium sp. Sd200]|uniref:beta strand repeat-containing protein n=1 Tax=Flavobacterium sp. Sd200 TaxID=2692211 RepID=UPI0013722A2C